MMPVTSGVLSAIGTLFDPLAKSVQQFKNPGERG